MSEKSDVVIKEVLSRIIVEVITEKEEALANIFPVQEWADEIAEKFISLNKIHSTEE